METSPLGSMPQYPSQLGYRVVQIGEERVPPRPRPVRPLISRPPSPPVRHTPADWWVPVLAVGAFTFVVAVVVLMVASSTSVPPPVVQRRVAALEPVPVQPPVRMAHIPAALAARPHAAEEKAEPAEIVEDDPAAGNRGRGRFGTTVVFVRNPIEAGRLAKVEGKLVFHLHVSGNFEDDAFT